MVSQHTLGEPHMETSLTQLVAKYDLANEITAEYAYQLNYAVTRFERYLQRSATVADLNEDNVNKWLKHERDVAEIADRSRANVRTSLLTLWKFYGQHFNREGIRSVVLSPKNPEAWHYEELEKVATAAMQLTGCLTNGIEKAQYMRTLLWFAYETGLRRRDIWSFDLHRFSENRAAAMTQHKTRRVHVVGMTTETEAELRAIAVKLRLSGNDHWRLPLRWPQSTSTFYDLMRKCRQLAGIDVKVRNRSLQHIRRTGATVVQMEGGVAWRFLGHAREGLDRKSYVDASKAISPTLPTRNRSQNHGCSQS